MQWESILVEMQDQIPQLYFPEDAPLSYENSLILLRKNSGSLIILVGEFLSIRKDGF